MIKKMVIVDEQHLRQEIQIDLAIEWLVAIGLEIEMLKV
jgi:hypothetical protein